MKGWGLREGRGSVSVGAGAHLPENQLPIHVHGQVPKVQEHLVRGQLLLNDVVPVDGHNGHTDEKVEVIRLGVWRVGFRQGLSPSPRPCLRWRLSAELRVGLGKPRYLFHPVSTCK